MALVGDAGLLLHLVTKFEVRRPSCLEDIVHLLCEHYRIIHKGLAGLLAECKVLTIFEDFVVQGQGLVN